MAVPRLVFKLDSLPLAPVHAEVPKDFDPKQHFKSIPQPLGASILKESEHPDIYRTMLEAYDQPDAARQPVTVESLQPSEDKPEVILPVWLKIKIGDVVSAMLPSCHAMHLGFVLRPAGIFDPPVCAACSLHSTCACVTELHCCALYEHAAQDAANCSCCVGMICPCAASCLLVVHAMMPAMLLW